MQKPAKISSTDSSGFLYAGIARDLGAQIARGVLRPGERLPSVRTLSRERGVSVSTAVTAYVLLEREGHVVARERSGYFVASEDARAPVPHSPSALVAPAPVGIGDLLAEVIRRAQDPALVPMGLSTPGPDLLPLARLNRALRATLARSPFHGASYAPVAGDPALRRQIARRAFLSGCTIDPAEVLVTNGGLESLNLALRAVTRAGDVVAVESPTYFGILQALQSLGLRAVEVPAVPGTGLRLDLLERVLRRQPVKAVVAMTTGHNPLGAVMTDAAKAALVELLARRQIPLVEDDVYGELAFGEARPRAAKAWDRRGLVVLCSSFSKFLSPGLRVGWVAGGRFRARLELLKGITSMSTASLAQQALAELLEEGFLERHLRRLRLRLAEQMGLYLRALAEALPAGTPMTRPAAGNLVWIQLPEGVDGTDVYRRALARGISIFPGEVFSNRGRHRGFIRVSAGAPWSDRMERGIRRLAEVCSDAACVASRRGNRR